MSTSDIVLGNHESDVCGIIVDNVSHIEWNENDWAYGCMFLTDSLLDSITSLNHDCYTKCAATTGKCLTLILIVFRLKLLFGYTQVVLILHGRTEFVRLWKDSWASLPPL